MSIKRDKTYDELKEALLNYLVAVSERNELTAPVEPPRRILRSQEDVEAFIAESAAYAEQKAAFNTKFNEVDRKYREAHHGLLFGGLIENQDYQFDIDGVLYHVKFYRSMGPEITIETWDDYQSRLDREAADRERYDD